MYRVDGSDCSLQAHQSRYCSGIKSAEESVAGQAAGLEALLKSQMSAALPGGGPGALSAADMISFLSAQQASRVAEEQKKNASSPPQPVRGKSPKAFSDSNQAKPTEPSEDFCCILCGFKESSVDKLKDHINMHFIGQVKKRKAESDVEPSNNESNENESAASSESWDDRIASKKVKKENDIETHEDSRGANIRNSSLTESEAEGKAEVEGQVGLACPNCNISFASSPTFAAHIKFYCKKKKGELD